MAGKDHKRPKIDKLIKSDLEWIDRKFKGIDSKFTEIDLK